LILGPLGIFELLQATEEVRDLILRSPTTAQLRAALAHTAHSSLRDSAFQLVARGLTSPDEVSRVLGIE
jgi:type II secretory ATPase GspE/PulE/Tfp pilus assembly ATPase PilB-like protein